MYVHVLKLLPMEHVPNQMPN